MQIHRKLRYVQESCQVLRKGIWRCNQLCIRLNARPSCGHLACSGADLPDDAGDEEFEDVQTSCEDGSEPVETVDLDKMSIPCGCAWYEGTGAVCEVPAVCPEDG